MLSAVFIKSQIKKNKLKRLQQEVIFSIFSKSREKQNRAEKTIKGEA
jgi:hypothetical protein